MFSSVISFKLNKIHLDRMVIGTFFIFVVAKINLMCSGGSSSVFNIALNAFAESI